MFRPELFETDERQEFFSDYCVSVLELFDYMDRYLDSLDRKIESIPEEGEDGLLIYINAFMDDMEGSVDGIRECFDNLLRGDITDEEIYYLKNAYEEMMSYKVDIECCLRDYER